MAIKLVVPVNGPITQLFGENPDIYKKWGFPGHNGIDYGIPNGTPVNSAAAGTVSQVSFENGGYGNYVKIAHQDGSKTFYTYYAHLASAAVSAGQKVKAGQVIGYSNNTGASTGPHLHFGLKIDGENPAYKGYVDPMPYFVSGGATAPEAPSGTEQGAFVALPDLKFEVTYESLNVRSGPGVEYPIIGQVAKGATFTSKKLSSRSVWVEVEPGKWCALQFEGAIYLKVSK
ncbi:MAG: peptidoglycan DD-metalloendopeptidase family protein [Chloroflexota bacterium]